MTPTPSKAVNLDEAVERLEQERDGYRVAAEIERGVMWALEPYVDQWRKLRDDKQDGGLLTRFVREKASSVANERRARETADAIDTVLSALSASNARAEAAEEALREAADALSYIGRNTFVVPPEEAGPGGSRRRSWTLTMIEVVKFAKRKADIARTTLASMKEKG